MKSEIEEGATIPTEVEEQNQMLQGATKTMLLFSHPSGAG